MIAGFNAIGPSELNDHGRDCCRFASAALLSRVDRGELAAAMAAVPALIEWAPTHWPAHWCELRRAGRHRGDCGVHAAVAALVLRCRGVKHARGRAVIRPHPPMAEHWRAIWARDGVPAPWLAEGLVRREVIEVGGRWWDPTEARWFAGAGAGLGAGLVVAVHPW